MPYLKAIVVTLAAVMALLVSAAVAVSPHFVSASVAGNTVSFKLAGLGNNQAINVSVAADVDCQNPGGNTAPGQRSTASGTFTSDKNGNVVGSLVLPNTCHSHWTPIFKNVSVCADGAGCRQLS